MRYMIKRLLLGLFLFLGIIIRLYAEINPQNLQDQKSYISSLSDRCWELREKNSDSSLHYGGKALQLAEEIAYDYEIARASGFLGVVYIHYLHKARKSIPYLQKALEYSLKVNDSVQLGYAYNNLGDAFMLTGNASLALQYGEHSLSIFTKLHHEYGIAYAYINLGLTHRMQKNFVQALEYFEKAKKIREKIDDKIGLASNLYEIAVVYEKTQKLDLAMQNYRRSYLLHAELNNVKYKAYCLNGIANIHYLNHQLDSALLYYNRAKELNLEKNYEFGLIDNYIGLAMVYVQKNMVLKGEKALSNAMHLSEKLAIPNKILETHESYSEFYKVLGDYKKAILSLNKFLHLYDSLLSIQRFETLNELQNRFYVNQRLMQTKTELHNKKKERNYLLVIILLLTMVFAIIIWKMITQHRLNKQLKEINHQKNKMFSVISHDLKTPFNSILGYSQLILEGLDDKEYKELEDYARTLNRSAEDSYNLLTRLLNWSRAQTGRIKFAPQMALVDELFNELLDKFELQAKDLNIRLIFENEIKEPLKLDLLILQIVLSNLISNALKFSKKGTSVNIRSIKKDTVLMILVKDEGTGIPDEILSKIWDRNFNYTTPGLRKEKGTGLGLQICKDLVQVHHGKISVESKIGVGTLFQISLPLH